MKTSYPKRTVFPMRLSEFQVKQVCQKILLGLKAKQLIQLKKPAQEVLAKMQEIFIKDLKVEDDINREAEKILAQYEAQMGDKIDRQKMFQMIKKQLVKDKGVIL
ncbi:MAG: DUF507 family protein [Proteobacteria bacterium]|nr:DUF507 family protein [Pseudomonadota bacterium]